MNKLLATLATMLAKALFDYAVEWLKDPANREDVEKVALFVMDHVTDVIPGQLDDHAVNALANMLSGKLSIPGLDQLTTLIAQLQALVRNPLGGIFGGR